MKKFTALLVILLAAAAFSPPAGAQITITASDVSAQFALGNFTTTRVDSITTSLNIGTRGATSWDFSGLKKSSTFTLTSVAVNTGGSASSFPGATYALQTSILYNLSGTVIPATAWIFLQLSTNLYNLGESATATGANATLIAKSTPADVFYKLPSTLGTTWTSTFADTTVISLGGIPISTIVAHHNASYVVDAYGLLKIPGGTTHQALRIRKTDSTTAKSISYIFIANDGVLINASAVDASAPDSGVINVYPTITWSDAVNTSVAASAPVPDRFSLMQNYPNPFNPSTVIGYTLPSRSLVHLAVYNVLGQRVADLVNGEQEAGIHSVEWRPATASGVYLYRMDAVALDKTGSTFSKVEKMSYLR